MNPDKQRISVSELRTIVSYDPETGVFTWIGHKTKLYLNGRVAGSRTSGGYWRLRINDIEYLGHIAAYALMTGSWPEDEVDHKDRVRSNNRWENLRPADHSIQQRNRSFLIGKSGFRGVIYQQNSKNFKVQIRVDGKCRHFGTFSDPAEAAKFYDQKVLELFGSDFPTNKNLGLL
jgi:hypothetical protein